MSNFICCLSMKFSRSIFFNTHLRGKSNSCASKDRTTAVQKIQDLAAFGYNVTPCFSAPGQGVRQRLQLVPLRDWPAGPPVLTVLRGGAGAAELVGAEGCRRPRGHQQLEQPAGEDTHSQQLLRRYCCLAWKPKKA